MSKIPKTAQEALALWDAGEPVPAFRVEAEDSEQEAIYATAFELIRTGGIVDGDTVTFASLVGDEFAAMSRKISERELAVARSIAVVAIKSGWAAMLRQHIGEDAETIFAESKTPVESTGSPEKAQRSMRPERCTPNAITYSVADCAESLTGIGIVWLVKADHGKCGCGKVGLANTIAYFVEKQDAVDFVSLKSQKK